MHSRTSNSMFFFFFLLVAHSITEFIIYYAEFDFTQMNWCGWWDVVRRLSEMHTQFWRKFVRRQLSVRESFHLISLVDGYSGRVCVCMCVCRMRVFMCSSGIETKSTFVSLFWLWLFSSYFLFRLVGRFFFRFANGNFYCMNRVPNKFCTSTQASMWIIALQLNRGCLHNVYDDTIKTALSLHSQSQLTLFLSFAVCSTFFLFHAADTTIYQRIYRYCFNFFLVVHMLCFVAMCVSSSSFVVLISFCSLSCSFFLVLWLVCRLLLLLGRSKFNWTLCAHSSRHSTRIERQRERKKKERNKYKTNKSVTHNFSFLCSSNNNNNNK